MDLGRYRLGRAKEDPETAALDYRYFFIASKSNAAEQQENSRFFIRVIEEYLLQIRHKCEE